MIYVFEADDGTQIEQKHDPNKVPTIGGRIEFEGVSYRRIAHFRVDRKPRERVHGEHYPYVSHALPRNIPDSVARKDSHGRVIVKNKRHEKSIASRYDMNKH